ncbi:MAG: hypothetical protein WBA93_32535 [Microcoleaceae cyanobacterium]
MKKPKAIPKDKLASLTPQQQEYLAELLWIISGNGLITLGLNQISTLTN